MARRLPDDPTKRRLQIAKRLYTHLDHFRALLEYGQMDLPGIVTIPETQEEIYLNDLMVGIDSLPPRQREAFELICLQGFTETDATRIMLPGSRWSTPCQQYADSALARMVQCYDDYQETGTKPLPYIDRKKKKAEDGKTINPTRAEILEVRRPDG